MSSISIIFLFIFAGLLLALVFLLPRLFSRLNMNSDARYFYRLATVIVCWLLSGWAIFGSFVAFFNLFFTTAQDINLKGLLVIAWILVQAFAWLALLVMSIGWVQNRRVHRAWVISGSLAGVVSMLPSPTVILFAISGIILALQLVRFHLGKSE